MDLKARAWVRCEARLGRAESRASAVGREAHVVACYEPHRVHNENQQVPPSDLDVVRLGRLAVGRIALADLSQAFSRDCDDLEIFRGTPLARRVGRVFRVGHRHDHHDYRGNLVHSGAAWVVSRYLVIEEPKKSDAKGVARRHRCDQSHS